MFRAPKLIFAKMALGCEAMLDEHGDYASLNTNFLYEPVGGLPLHVVAAYCNSILFEFFYQQLFGALRMSGGYYQFQAPQLRVVPFRRLGPRVERELEDLAKAVTRKLLRNPEADVSTVRDRINASLLRAFGVSDSERLIIEAEVAGVAGDDDSASGTAVS